MKTKRIFSLFLAVILLLCAGSAAATGGKICGIWKCANISVSGESKDMAEIGYSLFLVILPDGVAYVYGSMEGRVDSSAFAYETGEKDTFQVTYPDGTTESGIFTHIVMRLEDENGAISTFLKTHNIFPVPAKAGSLKDFYGTWEFSWTRTDEEPYVASQEMLESLGLIQSGNFEIEVNEDGLYYRLNGQEIFLHPYLSDGLLRTEEESEFIIGLTNYGELEMTLDDVTYYFKNKTDDSNPNKAKPGGIRVDFTAGIPAGMEGDFDVLSRHVIGVVRTRLDNEGLPDVQFTRDGDGIFHAEIPTGYFKYGQYQYIIDLITDPGEITFRDPVGEAFMTGEMIQSAEYIYDERGHQIIIKLTDEGTALFGEYTTRYIAQNISIWMDNECLVDARINEPILDGTCVIVGKYTELEAKAIAAKIISGSLPMTLTVDKMEAWLE